MAPATTSHIHGYGDQEPESFGEKSTRPMPTYTNGSQDHTSPRAELLAIVIAIEQARSHSHLLRQLGICACSSEINSRGPNAYDERQCRLMDKSAAPTYL